MIRRRYNQWSGNPLGSKEDPNRCIVEIEGRGAWAAAERHQCGNRRGHGADGTLCRKHAELQASGKGLRIPPKTRPPGNYSNLPQSPEVSPLSR